MCYKATLFAEATSEKVGILCCVRVDKDTGIVYRPIRWTGNRWRKLLTSDSEIAKTPILIGAAGFSGMFLNVSILNEVGYPRQDYFIDYDDYEFCLRVRAHSLPIYYVPAAKIKHSVGQLSVATFWGKTFLSSNHPPYRYYYQARNRLYTHWYAHRNFAASMWALLSVLKLLARVAFFERKTIKKTYFILRGVVDGLHGKMGKQIETGNG